MAETYKILPTGEVEKTIPEVKEVISAEAAQEQLAQLKKRVVGCPMCRMARAKIAQLEAVGIKVAVEEIVK